jgi:hypothetical protein
MTISQLSDQQIIAAVQSIGSSSEDNGLTYGFSINKTFFIYVKAAHSNSQPNAKLEHLEDYQKVSIELYHYKELPPTEETRMDPIEFESKDEEGNIKVYKFEFDVKVFPHLTIDPTREEPFKSQPWAQSFERGRFVNYTALLPWRDVCDVIRYCDKISRLKLFW